MPVAAAQRSLWSKGHAANDGNRCKGDFRLIVIVHGGHRVRHFPTLSSPSPEFRKPGHQFANTISSSGLAVPPAATFSTYV